MNSPSDSKLTGINTWFVIEILSFYGYILSAIAFIFTHSLMNNIKPKYYDCHVDRYKSDFVAYHRKDLDWLAFVSILFNVNVGLIMIDKFYVFETPESREGK